VGGGGGGGGECPRPSIRIKTLMLKPQILNRFLTLFYNSQTTKFSARHMYTRHNKHQMERRQNGVIIKQFDTYGSVSAGREKWQFNVLFLLKVEPPCDQT